MGDEERDEAYWEAVRVERKELTQEIRSLAKRLEEAMKQNEGAGFWSRIMDLLVRHGHEPLSDVPEALVSRLFNERGFEPAMSEATYHINEQGLRSLRDTLIQAVTEFGIETGS